MSFTFLETYYSNVIYSEKYSSDWISQSEKLLFQKNIHRTREPIQDFVDSRDSEKVFFPRLGKFEFSRNEKLEHIFPQKVSGNCSHTFSLFCALFFLYFSICLSSNLSSNFLYFCAAIPVERLLCFGYLYIFITKSQEASQMISRWKKRALVKWSATMRTKILYLSLNFVIGTAVERQRTDNDKFIGFYS